MGLKTFKGSKKKRKPSSSSRTIVRTPVIAVNRKVKKDAIVTYNLFHYNMCKVVYLFKGDVDK